MEVNFNGSLFLWNSGAGGGLGGGVDYKQKLSAGPCSAINSFVISSKPLSSLWTSVLLASKLKRG